MGCNGMGEGDDGKGWADWAREEVRMMACAIFYPPAQARPTNMDQFILATGILLA